MVNLFEDKFMILIKKEKKGLFDEIIKDILNYFEKNMIEEIKHQINTNIINIENNFAEMKENFCNYLFSAEDETKTKGIKIINGFSEGTNSLFDNLKNSFKEFLN